MDCEANMHDLLERMLQDASAEPTQLPLSLLKAITNNFSDGQQIGSGGFAVVYKGLLQKGTVAVKKLSQTFEVDEKKFCQELDSLMRVKHKNIVRFLGYCADTQGKVCKWEGKNVMAEERQRLLCFEFMPKGGLDKYVKDTTQGLDWRTLYNIIKGICEGLHYLHKNNIVHLDLKPANILLNDYMVPKIADFGISRCFDEEQTRVATSKVYGTLGYMAPEFYNEVITITFKSDIYSLGTIIIEMLTGRKGYPDIDNAHTNWSTRLGNIPGDPQLEHVKACLEMGIKCIDLNPTKRPTTQRIIDMLVDMEHTYGFNKTDSCTSSAAHNIKSSEGVLNHVNNLLAMSTLENEEEFKQLMGIFSKPIEPDFLFDCLPKSLRPTKGDNETDGGSSSDHPSKGLETDVYRTPTLIPPRILPLMNDIAQQLVQAGNQQTCYKIYRDSRASALEVSLRKLGVEKLTKDDVQKMQWEALEAKIGNWIHFMRIAVKLLLAGERKLCDQIFDGVNFNKGHCFAELAANSIKTLFSFGDAVAKSRAFPEKLFVLLDMYEVMRELQPEIEEIFEGKPCTEMREAASSLTKLLAQTVLEIFANFEDAVEKDASKSIVQNGTVHPLTSYVIDYVKLLFDYQSTLKLLFQEFDSGTEAESQLAAVTTRILQALQNNLDGKSKQYTDPALTYLFLMNNIHYMVISVRRSEAKYILGDDWIQRHRRILQQNAEQYKHVAWAKILQTLSVQGAGSSGDLTSSGVSRATIKERFKSFNMQFEELHAKQSQWDVPHHELRESLRLAVAEVLLPAYRSFIKRFGNLVESNKNPQKYVRYSPEAVDQLLGQFFEGQQRAMVQPDAKKARQSFFSRHLGG